MGRAEPQSDLAKRSTAEIATIVDYSSEREASLCIFYCQLCTLVK